MICHFFKRFTSGVLGGVILLLVACSSSEISIPEEQVGTRLPAEVATTVPIQLLTPMNSTVETLEITPTVVSTPLPTAAAVPTLTTTTPTISATIVPSTAPFGTFWEGTIIAFRVAASNGELYLLLFDIESKTFREIRNELVDYPLELQWFGNGCQLFVRGYLTNLRGETHWQAPELGSRAGNFSGTRLSPDKKWLANQIYSAEITYNNAESINMELINMIEPENSILLTQNGGAITSAAWSVDSQWVAFTDYDNNGILQVYRATSDGSTIQQLTYHTEPVAQIAHLTWAPNGEHLAYSVSNLQFSSLPYEYKKEDEGWVNIVSVTDNRAERLSPSKFGFVEGIWWSVDSLRIVFAGSSLPISDTDPLSGPQIHWGAIQSSTITNSFYKSDAPSDYFSMPLPAGNIDTIILNSNDSLYLYNSVDDSYEKVIDNFKVDGLILNILGSPFGFPGELNCQNLN